MALRRGCLALTTAVKEFAPHLQGREFTLITDNLALVYINKHNDAHSKLFRMKMDLMDTIVYRPGAQNRVADALTRLEFEEELPLDQFLKKYAEDALKTRMIRVVTRSGVSTTGEPVNKTKAKPFINCLPGLATEDGEYDRIFSIVTNDNYDLIHKLAPIVTIDETEGLIKLTDIHYMVTVPSTVHQQKLDKITYQILKHCTENDEITSVAINTDLRAKQLFILKYMLETSLINTNIHITLHTNQIMQLTDPRQIENA